MNKKISANKEDSSRLLWGRIVYFGVFGTLVFLVFFALFFSSTNIEGDEIAIATSFDPITVLSTPFVIPTSTISHFSFPSATSTHLAITDTPISLSEDIQKEYLTVAISCRQVERVNLRKSPGYKNKDDKRDVIAEIPCGEYLELQNQTKYVDELTWWRVKWGNYYGWVSDHTGSGKTILTFDQPSSFSQSDPAEFAFWYFNAVWQKRDYKSLWDNFLTKSFQQHSSSSSFNEYAKWWGSVERIEVNSVQVIRNDGNNAWIKINLNFYMSDGRFLPEREYDYNLTFNETKRIWMFDYR